MNGQKWLVNSDRTLGNFIAHVTKLHETSGWVTYGWRTGRQRTATQNNSIHLYCRMVADELNDKGFPAFLDSSILKESIEIDWTQSMVKDLWRTVQCKLFPDTEGKTSRLSRTEVSGVYDVINRALIEKTSGRVCVVFPHVQTPVSNKKGKSNA